MSRVFFAMFLAAAGVATVNGRRCYHCLVKDGCITLDASKPNVTKECRKGVEHCVTSVTFSKVTGAVAFDYSCGGIIYNTADQETWGGNECFRGVDNPGDRTTRSVCYCSKDLCNGLSSIRSHLGLVVFLLLFTTRWMLL